MFITRTERKIDTFYLDKRNEREAYEDIINNPAINVLDKKFESTTETVYEGETSSSITRPYVRVEYEVCSL